MCAMRRTPGPLLLTLILTTGCSIPEDKRLSEIDSAQWERICEAATEDNADTVYDCGDGEQTAPAYTVQRCLDDNDGLYLASCTAVFNDWETCMTWQSEMDICDPGQPPPGCVAIETCREQATATE